MTAERSAGARMSYARGGPASNRILLTGSLERLVARRHSRTSEDWAGPVGAREILINAAASPVQKHLTLLHELIHVAEEKLVQGKVLSRRSGERRVGHLATTLFGILAISGLWRPLRPGEAARFYARREGRLREGFRSPAVPPGPLAERARKTVTVGLDRHGWYLMLADSASPRVARHWNVVSCADEAHARALARVIRRAIVDGIRDRGTHASHRRSKAAALPGKVRSKAARE